MMVKMVIIIILFYDYGAGYDVDGDYYGWRLWWWDDDDDYYDVDGDYFDVDGLDDDDDDYDVDGYYYGWWDDGYDGNYYYFILFFIQNKFL
jgi:hypothetical protein